MKAEIREITRPDGSYVIEGYRWILYLRKATIAGNSIFRNRRLARLSLLNFVKTYIGSGKKLEIEDREVSNIEIIV